MIDMVFNRLIPEILVSDIEKSKHFYINILGFHIRYAREDEDFYFLEKEGSQFMMEPYKDSRRFCNGKPEHPFGRGINFQIEVADVDGLYQRLQENNYPIFYDVEEKWYRCGDTEEGIRQFVVADPDGYLWRFNTELGQRSLS